MMDRELPANVALSLFTIAICVVIVEGASAVLLSRKAVEKPGIIEVQIYDTEPDDDLGYILMRNNTYTSVKAYGNGTLIYRTTYRSDEHRRRTVNQTYYPDRPHIILFGCSCAYGEGLDDNGTLQYALGNLLPGYNIYNYAAAGWGPQQMLALLESGRLPEEVDSDGGFAIYVFVDPHLDRGIGSTRVPWLYNSPYYRLDGKGRLRRDGSFETGRPVTTAAFRLINEAKGYSNFLRLINLEVPANLSDEDVRLNFEIIRGARREYERQFNGTFIVLIHSIHWDTYLEQRRRLAELLKEEGIPVLHYQVEYSPEDRIQGDEHPTAELNYRMAYNISETLRRDFGA